MKVRHILTLVGGLLSVFTLAVILSFELGGKRDNTSPKVTISVEEVPYEHMPVGDVVVTDCDTTIYVDEVPVYIIVEPYN